MRRPRFGRSRRSRTVVPEAGITVTRHCQRRLARDRNLPIRLDRVLTAGAVLEGRTAR
jgi:hypothetical protein